MKKISRYSFIILYGIITISILLSFTGDLVFERTPLSVVVATVIATWGATLLAALPAWLVAGGLVGVFALPASVRRLSSLVSYMLAGMPSIIIGVIGLLVFCNWMQLGWSLLAAMLTLVLLLFPALVTAFVQLLEPLRKRYVELARNLDIGPLEFLCVLMPRLRAGEIIELLIFGWTRALGDTAAVMLTCGALLEMPSSLLDSVRLLNYHIYMLAMDVPGGMPEARSLSLVLILGLFALLFIPRLIANLQPKPIPGESI